MDHVQIEAKIFFFQESSNLEIQHLDTQHMAVKVSSEDSEFL